MITLPQLTELLGWAVIINLSFLILVFITLTTMKKKIMSIHSKMFGINDSDLNIIYFKYMASYKTLTIIFMVTPYIALKIMGY